MGKQSRRTRDRRTLKEVSVDEKKRVLSKAPTRPNITLKNPNTFMTEEQCTLVYSMMETWTKIHYDNLTKEILCRPVEALVARMMTECKNFTHSRILLVLKDHENEKTFAHLQKLILECVVERPTHRR